MTLIFDIGNTAVVMAIYDGDTLLQTWRFSSHYGTEAHFAEEISNACVEARSKFGASPIDGVAYASVVPKLNFMLEAVVKRLLGLPALCVNPNCKFDAFREMPEELGADRIADIVMAQKKYGSPCIVVDIGTTITFDVVSQVPSYLGGAISLGIKSMFEVLGSNTALLPKTIMATEPEVATAYTTETQMQSGVVFGTAGLVDGIVSRMWEELGQNCPVIATGGDARLISKFSKTINIYDPNLTLEGIKYIYELNK